MYIILRIRGFTFATDGMDYIILNPQGVEVYRDMDKVTVERKLRELTA